MNKINQKKSAVVISGIGVFTPLGRNSEALCEAVLRKESSVAPAVNYDASKLLGDRISEFSWSDTFDLGSEIIAGTDRGVWFTIKSLDEALANANLKKESINSSRTAVVVGTSHSGIQHVEKIFKAVNSGNAVSLEAADFFAALTDHVATKVCQYLGLTGIKITISSACSSSNTAVGYGHDLILTGQADTVIVVGTDTVSESIVAGFNSLKVLSEEVAAPFSEPSGITLGEGAGVVILEQHAACKSRGISHRGEIIGYALSSDAFHATSVDETGEGIAAAIQNAIKDAGIEPKDIDYISAHGTGTDSNDVAESLAMERIFGREVPVSSAKSIVGHTLGASGVIELIITLLNTEKGFLPPTANFKNVRPGCAHLNYVGSDPCPADVSTFLCNNYGFGGNNSSLVVSRASGRRNGRQPDQEKVYISAFGNYSANALGGNAWLASLDNGVVIEENDNALHTFVGTVEKAIGRGARNSRRSSPSIRFAVEAVQDAITHFDLASLMQEKRYETGLVAGLLHGAQNALEKYMRSIMKDGLAYASSTQFPLTTLNAAAGEVSIHFGIKGFNTTLCGPVGAVKFACDMVSLRRQERIFAFSTDELSPMVLQVCDQLGVLGRFESGSPVPGFFLNEGANVLMLESGQAIDRREGRKLAEVVSIATAQDGLGHTLDLDGRCLERIAKSALADSGTQPEDIDLVIGVGQGTSLFLDAERSVIHRIFADKLPDLTSVAMHHGYAPSAIFPQMLSYGAAILNGQDYWKASITGNALWRPTSKVSGDKVSHILILFSSVTFEHSAIVLRRVV